MVGLVIWDAIAPIMTSLLCNVRKTKNNAHTAHKIYSQDDFTNHPVKSTDGIPNEVNK